MDIKEIKQVVDLMKRSSLTEFELEKKDFKIRICRKSGESQPLHQGAQAPSMPVQVQSAQAQAAQESSEEPKDNGKTINSPMVGTFYTAPSPDSAPFVKVGDNISEDSVVCIIEAMKVMNEIKAEVSGTIAEVLVQNGESVEYGQPLFRVQ